MAFIIVHEVSTTSDTQSKNYETLLVERNGGVVTITFNRPKSKNAVNGVMWIELLELLTEIQHTSTDRVVVLTGANGEFCSGADLVAMGDGSGRAHSHSYYSMREVTGVIMALSRLPQPTIAKVRGVAVGVGCNMALGCDLLLLQTLRVFRRSSRSAACRLMVVAHGCCRDVLVCIVPKKWRSSPTSLMLPRPIGLDS